jgi:cytochrome c oxidase cbb3-type subunit 4
MSYETVTTITQSLALIFFILLFAGVVIYVFWPGNRDKFERAARLPFEPDKATEEKGKG